MTDYDCCLSTAIVIAFIICICWYVRTTPASVVGYWATLGGSSYEISASPDGGLLFTGSSGKVKGGINSVRAIWMGKMRGYLMSDSRTIYWYGGEEWYRQGV